jgi:hypothetical protein
MRIAPVSPGQTYRALVGVPYLGRDWAHRR